MSQQTRYVASMFCYTHTCFALYVHYTRYLFPEKLFICLFQHIFTLLYACFSSSVDIKPSNNIITCIIELPIAQCILIRVI